MRHFSRSAALWASRCCVAAIVCVNVVAVAHAQKSANETIVVTLDRATILQLPQNAVTIIIGNPSVADVTMIKKSNQMVLTGKGFGQTNLIALDSTGKSVGESNIRASKTKLTLWFSAVWSVYHGIARRAATPPSALAMRRVS